MNAEHTPGPWKIEHSTNGTFPYRIVKFGERNPIASCRGISGKESEDAANARLIAAAPNLLEACKTLVRRAETMTDGEWGEPEEIAQAKAAIAQAEKGE